MALKTRFTELVGCEVPLQQAGMGGVATVELAAAVADAGALGMVTMAMMPPDAVAEALDRLGETTSGVFGFNTLMPFCDRACVEAASSRARVIEFFYGDPDPDLVAIAHEGGGLACWQVGSAEEARAAEDAGCDLVVAQGTEAGGHVRGSLSLLPLLDAVLKAVSVPVVAAGGIATPRGMAAALAAGADAVRIGTRFVATEESAAHPSYKESLVKAQGDDTVLTTAFSVMWPDAPHRVLRSSVEAAEAFQGDVVAEVEVAPGVKMPVPRFAVPTPTSATTGTVEAMPLYAGEGVGGVRAVERAGDVVRELVEGAERLLGTSA